MLNRVLAIDKVLFEQQLGLTWQPPSISPIMKEDLPSYKKAMEQLYRKFNRLTGKTVLRRSFEFDYQ